MTEATGNAGRKLAKSSKLPIEVLSATASAAPPTSDKPITRGVKCCGSEFLLSLVSELKSVQRFRVGVAVDEVIRELA